MPSLSQRIRAVRPSGTAVVFDEVAALRARGESVLSLSVGEPDFPTPPHIIEATKDALDRGHTRYTAVAGMQSLREAICEDSMRRRGVAHSPEEVVVSAGAKHALFNLAGALFEPGDRVVIPTPCWASYVEQARFFGAAPVLLPTVPEQGFVPDPDQLAAALAPGAKAVVLCAPSNPTGAVPSRDAWLSIAEVLRRSDAFILVDEIYSRLTFDGPSLSLLSVAPDLRERMAIVDGVSKTFAMTGFRVGWSLTGLALARALVTLQGQATTNVAAMAQVAATAALTGDQVVVDRMVDEFAARRDLLCHGIADMDGLTVPVRPRGAFYVLVDARRWLQRAPRELPDDVALARRLLKEQRLAVVPGSAFHAEGHLRLSFAASRADLRDALGRLGRFAESIAGSSVG